MSASYSRCRRTFKLKIYRIIFSADSLPDPELIKIQGRRCFFVVVVNKVPWRCTSVWERIFHVSFMSRIETSSLVVQLKLKITWREQNCWFLSGRVPMHDIKAFITAYEGIRTAHAYKIAYLRCTLNLNSNSKNEAFSLNISPENEGQIWHLRALFWKYLWSQGWNPTRYFPLLTENVAISQPDTR